MYVLTAAKKWSYSEIFKPFDKYCVVNNSRNEIRHSGNSFGNIFGVFVGDIGFCKVDFLIRRL